MRVELDGLQETLEAMRKRAERTADLEPVLRTFSEDLVTRIDSNYRDGFNWDGEPFAPLKPATISARLAKLPGAKKRDKKGRLTPAARAKRRAAEAFYHQEAAAGRTSNAMIKTLIDSADMVNSNHADPPDAVSFEWSSLGYLGYHMSGTSRMEARNPTPFEWKHGFWKLNDELLEEFGDAVKAYIVKGDL